MAQNPRGGSPCSGLADATRSLSGSLPTQRLHLLVVGESMMDNQPASPGPTRVTPELGTPVMPEERVQSKNLRALYANMRWCTNTCQAESTSPPRDRPNPSKDNCQPESAKGFSEKHEDDIDHGYVHVNSARNLDSVDLFQEVETDDFVLINTNENPVGEASPSTTTTTTTIEPLSRLPSGGPSLSTVAPNPATAVSDVSNIGKRVSPPTEVTLTPVENSCKCGKTYMTEAAIWMTEQLRKSVKFRYQTQCRRESKLASFELDSSKYNDLEECHRFDQPCCDPHVNEVLDNCLCNKLPLKQRRAYMIRACLQTQSLTGIHLPITINLMRDGTSLSPLEFSGCYSTTIVPGYMIPHKCSGRNAGKHRKTSPGRRTTHIFESLPPVQPPMASSTVDPSHPSTLTRARQRVLSDLLEQHRDLDPKFRRTEQRPPKQATQPVIPTKPCDGKSPIKQNDPALEKRSAQENPVPSPPTQSAPPEPHKPRSKRLKTNIEKEVIPPKYDSPQGTIPAGIRDASLNEELSALAAGRAWSASVAAQDAAEVSIRKAINEVAAQQRYRDSLRS